MKKTLTILMLTLFVAFGTTGCSIFVKRTGKPVIIEEKKDNGVHKGQIKKNQNDQK